MKRKILTMFLLSISAITFADVKTEKSIGSDGNKQKLVGGYDLGLGYYQLDYKVSGEGRESLGGYSVLAGKEFVFKKDFITKSQIEFGNVENDANYNGYGTDTRLTHFNFTQSLGYIIKRNNIVFKPFVAIGFGDGDYRQKIDGFSQADRLELGIDSVSINTNYSSTIRTLGLQATFSNGLSPFITYNIRDIRFGSPDVALGRNGFKNSVNVGDIKLDNTTSSSFNFGVSYHF